MWSADTTRMNLLFLFSQIFLPKSLLKQRFKQLSKQHSKQHRLTLALLLFCTPAAANQDTISCDLTARQQNLGALPNFEQSSTPLTGFSCQSTPYISSYLGNWFPSLPHIMYSQSTRSQADIDDYNQQWGASLGIKRIAQGQLYIFANQSLSRSTLESNKDINFVPKNISSANQAISLNKHQQIRLSHQQSSWGIGLQFPYIPDQPLTKVLLRQTIIDQPMQANIQGFNDRSLFEVTAKLTEVEIGKQSFHRGFNVNWQITMGLGDVEMEPKNLTTAALNTEQDKIISLGSEIEIYYQHRINRRWFTYARGVGEIQYWHQSAKDENFELETYRWLEYQAHLGIGMSF